MIICSVPVSEAFTRLFDSLRWLDSFLALLLSPETQ